MAKAVRISNQAWVRLKERSSAARQTLLAYVDGLVWVPVGGGSDTAVGPRWSPVTPRQTTTAVEIAEPDPLPVPTMPRRVTSPEKVAAVRDLMRQAVADNVGGRSGEARCRSCHQPWRLHQEGQHKNRAALTGCSLFVDMPTEG